MYDDKLQLELSKLLYAIYVHTYIQMLYNKRNMAVGSGHEGHLLSQNVLFFHWYHCTWFGQTCADASMLISIESMTSLGVHSRIVIATWVEEVSDV